MSGQIDLLDPTTVRDGQGRIVGHVALVNEASLASVYTGLEAMGTVHAHRLFKMLILRSHEVELAGDDRFDVLVFPGGLSEIAQGVGLNPKKHTSKVRDILNAGGCIQWNSGYAEGGGLWTWTHLPSRGGLKIKLADVLCPGYAPAMRGDYHKARRARRLVPELQHGPPVTGRNNEHAAIWTLHRRVLVEAVDNSKEMAREGGVLIPGERWQALAKRSNLPPRSVEPVVAAYLEGDGEAPPFLQQVGVDRFTLSDAHELERAFIEDAGRTRIERQRAGQIGAKAKGKKRGKASD